MRIISKETLKRLDLVPWSLKDTCTVTDSDLEKMSILYKRACSESTAERNGLQQEQTEFPQKIEQI